MVVPMDGIHRSLNWSKLYMSKLYWDPNFQHTYCFIKMSKKFIMVVKAVSRKHPRQCDNDKVTSLTPALNHHTGKKFWARSSKQDSEDGRCVMAVSNPWWPLTARVVPSPFLSVSITSLCQLCATLYIILNAKTTWLASHHYIDKFFTIFINPTLEWVNYDCVAF